jgi:Kef-type K+ transport system membrane component KefB
VSFFLEILVVLLAVKLAGQLSRLLGQPSVLGKLLVGVLVGPAVLGWLHPSPLIAELAEVGVILLMFQAGLETNLEAFKRSALAATLVAIGGVVLPFLGGWGTATLWGYPLQTAVFTGVLLVATSVSISAQTLRELGQLKSRSGVTILAAAVLDDVLGIVVLSVVLGALGGDVAAAAGGGGAGHGSESIGVLLLKMAVFFGGAGFVGWKVLPPLIRRFAKFQVGAPLLTAGIAVAIGYAYVAEAAGLAGIIGAYLAGLALSNTDFKSRMMHDVEQTAFGFFVPFFFVSVGLTANFAGMSGPFIAFVAVLAVVAVLTKVVGCGAGAIMARFPTRQAVGIGAGMVARGEVGLIVATLGLERGLLQPELYTAMVIVSLLTTLVTPPLLKAAFRHQPEAGPTSDED